MISILRLKELLLEVKDKIDAVKKTHLVVDDSELVSFLKDMPESDNIVLVGVIPDFKLLGTEDQSSWNNMLTFMFFEKSSQRDMTDDDYIDVFTRTQQAAKDFVLFLLETKAETGTICGLTDKLKEDSILLRPIYKKAQCNGWMVEIDLETDW